MGKMKKKYSSGTAKTYMSRNKALRVLQLSLADFRRLCILKGVYPVEPRSLKKATKGAPKVRTFFLRQDIRFLLHEPIINTFREIKIYARKLKKYKNKQDMFQFERIERSGKPLISLDHIILERYPKFNDALNDLDDCLCLIVLYSTYPMDKMVDSEIIIACRRLIVEFMNYVMLTKSLKKCFISIKGFYFQARICGQDVTWIMPHQVGYTRPFDVDLKIMGTFLEFYVQLLGFVVFKLYNDARFVYPPKFEFKADTGLEKMISQTEFFEEMLSSFSMEAERVVSVTEGKDEDEEEFDKAIPSADLDTVPLLQRLFYERLDGPHAQNSLPTLFSGMKFFINREVPLEVFAFGIRSCGGEVSWPKDAHCGSSFDADDASITHELVDRPVEYSKRVISRCYIQPQWVFDCINFRRIQPTEPYGPSLQTPPHFSPFVTERPGEYVSRDKLKMMGITDEREIDAIVKENEQGPETAGVGGMGAEERKLRESMMPKKLKRIYKKAVHAEKKEKTKVTHLKMKKRVAERADKDEKVHQKTNAEKKRKRKRRNRRAKLAGRETAAV